MQNAMIDQISRLDEARKKATGRIRKPKAETIDTRVKVGVLCSKCGYVAGRDMIERVYCPNCRKKLSPMYG